eukprot:Clim_evm10s226 gene=Clim_evmTU10s226
MEQFATGALAGMSATCVIQPIDLVKTRLQIQKSLGGEMRGPIQTFVGVIREEGFLGLYSGLSAALFRQLTYTGTRLGIFTFGMDKLTAKMGADNIQFYHRAGLGLFAGACGAIAGNPAEVALVRMTADGRLPPAERRNYKSVFDALIRVVREEGVLRLWRGVSPTVARAMLLNAAQLATYSQAKAMLQRKFSFPEGVPLHLTASTMSGLCASFVSLPADIVKTRVQNARVIDGKPEYSGNVDAAMKMIRKEGFFSLWTGFPTFFVRIGGHTILTFLFLEQIRGFVKAQKEKAASK